MALDGIGKDSVYWIGAWTAVVLVFFTILYDVLGEKITEKLEEKAQVKHEEEVISFDKQEHQLRLSLWRRFRAEVTTLGFLAFTTYIFSEANFFEAVTDAGGENGLHPPKAADIIVDGEKQEGGGDERRRLMGAFEASGRYVLGSLVVPVQRMLGVGGRMLAEEGGAADREPADYAGCDRFIFSEAQGLEDHAEAVVRARAPTTTRSWPRMYTYPHPPSPRSRTSNVTTTALAPCRAQHFSFFITMCLYFSLIGAALHIFVWRFHQSIGKLDGFENRVKYLLSKARALPNVQALMQANPKIQKMVDSNTLCYATYMKWASREYVEMIIEFPVWTWVVLGLYLLLSAILSYYACADEAVTMSIFCGILYAMAVFFIVRLVLYGAIMSTGKGERDPYPCAQMERFLLLGPFCSGFLPWRREPSRQVALCIQQAWLWFSLQRLAFNLINKHGGLYNHEAYGVESHSFIGPVTHTILTAIISFSLFTIKFPFLIEIYSLPPLSDNACVDECLCKALKECAEFMEPGQQQPTVVAAAEQMDVDVVSATE